MEKRDTQTSNRPTQRDDGGESPKRDQNTKRNPNEPTQNKGDASHSGRQSQPQSSRRTDDDESDDETSSTPGGNPARGVAPGISNPQPGSVREQQTPGCSGLDSGSCAGDDESGGQMLGERHEQRPL